MQPLLPITNDFLNVHSQFTFQTEGNELPATDDSNRSLRYTNNVWLQHISMQQTCHTCVIPGFHHEVDVKCAILGYYAASSGNFLPTLLDNLVPKYR